MYMLLLALLSFWSVEWRVQLFIVNQEGKVFAEWLVISKIVDWLIVATLK